MLYQWKVQYIDIAGTISEETVIAEKYNDAIKSVRDSIPDIEVVGAYINREDMDEGISTP